MTDININDIHYKRYLKYKSKYLELKQSGSGGLSRSSGSSPRTVETLKHIKKNLYFGKGFQWHKEIDFDFEQIINDLKTDLTNNDSKFDQTLLDTFVESPTYTRVIFEIAYLNYPPKVDLKTNFKHFSYLEYSGHITNIHKYTILSIKKFIMEIKTELEKENFKNMKYKNVFKEILTIYLERFETYYNKYNKELDKHKDIESY
jgi:hypothetical protein